MKNSTLQKNVDIFPFDEKNTEKFRETFEMIFFNTKLNFECYFQKLDIFVYI